MSWYRVSDDEPLHRKIRPLSDVAYRLNMQAGIYCSRYLSDGLIWLKDWEEITLGIKGKKQIKPAVRELEEAGLWHVAGETCSGKFCPARIDAVPDGAWCKHDYWEYNLTKEEAEHRREKAQATGRLGGLQKSLNARKARKASTRLSTELSDALSVVPSTASSTSSTNDPVPSRPVPVQGDLSPSPTSSSKPARTPGLTMTAEGRAIAERWHERTGRRPTDAEIGWIEAQVASCPNLDADGFRQAMKDADEKTHGAIRRLAVYEKFWRAANAYAGDHGASRASRGGMVSVADVLASGMAR